MDKQARSFLSNIATLGLSVILALFIWYTATQADDPTRSQFYPLRVSFVGQSEDSILFSPTGAVSVQVRAEGADSVLTELSPLDFSARVDLSQVPIGVETAVAVSVITSAEVEITETLPEQITVLLEQQISREIPVELDLRGSAARGHSQGDPLIEPATITVSGPASRVEELDFALVTAFLNNTRETEVGTHTPIFYDAKGRVAGTGGLELDTQQVQVTIPIEESAGFAEKLITVNWDGEPAPGYRLLSVTVEPPSVLVQGLPASVNTLTRLQTEPIDITGLAKSFEQRATLDLPAGIILDQDQEIIVNIEIEPILSTGTRRQQVELLGIGEDVTAIIDPEEVRVVLFGPLPVLDSLLDEDVRVTVDLFGLEPGTYALEPDVDLPDRGIEVRSINPKVVAVTISPTITNTDNLTDTIQTPSPTSNSLATAVAQAINHNSLPQNQTFCLADGQLMAPSYSAACPSIMQYKENFHEL